MLRSRFGFIDKTGKIVITPRFTSPGAFAEGLASVRIGGKASNPASEMVIGPLGGRYAYIDKSGKTVIDLGDQVENAEVFSEGLAAVEITGHRGFINRTGKLVIEPKFGGQPRFCEGLAFVIIGGGGGIGFIDKDGVLVLQSSFALAENFRDGLAVVYDSLDLPNARLGYIDQSAKLFGHPQNSRSGQKHKMTSSCPCPCC